MRAWEEFGDPQAWFQELMMQSFHTSTGTITTNLQKLWLYLVQQLSLPVLQSQVGAAWKPSKKSTRSFE